jgi:hypothetical protein
MSGFERGQVENVCASLLTKLAAAQRKGATGRAARLSAAIETLREEWPEETARAEAKAHREG